VDGQAGRQANIQTRLTDRQAEGPSHGRGCGRIDRQNRAPKMLIPSPPRGLLPLLRGSPRRRSALLAAATAAAMLAAPAMPAKRHSLGCGGPLLAGRTWRPPPRRRRLLRPRTTGCPTWNQGRKMRMARRPRCMPERMAALAGGRFQSNLQGGGLSTLGMTSAMRPLRGCVRGTHLDAAGSAPLRGEGFQDSVLPLVCWKKPLTRLMPVPRQGRRDGAAT
jgi:hypothetical protein